MNGLVEDFTRKIAVGWVSVPADAPPTKVSLHVGRLQVAATYATADAAMSGVHVDVAGKVTPPGEQTNAPAAHAWRYAGIKSPKGDRRNSRQQIRTFSFRTDGIWDYVHRRTNITIQVGGRPLPINRHGMFLSPRKQGRFSVADLEAKFDEGYVLSQMGQVQLSKRLDTAWQNSSMQLYSRVRKILATEHGYDAFLIYGTLLGAVREGGYIGHDADFDAAYVSRFQSGPEAADELVQIALTMIKHGFGVDLRARLLHVHSPDDDDFHIDLFHTYFEAGRLRFPFGIAGTSTISEDDWTGTHEIDFPGGRVLVPNNAEQLVAHLYGDDWRRPKPGFTWNLDRTDQAAEAQLSVEKRTMVYWAAFYARTEYNSGSTFFEFVNARPDCPSTVIDIGCGDGRDSCAFGAAGRTVLGLDQSTVGIANAAAHARSAGVGDGVSFRVCDVADVDDLGGALDSVVVPSTGPVLFYLRFFLHAIPEEVQERLLVAIRLHARAGDQFAAEFRTDKDASNAKVHTKHFRRFQSAQEFRQALTSRFGFEIAYEHEGTGLSPYGEEDPVLYRVIARRP